MKRKKQRRENKMFGKKKTKKKVKEVNEEEEEKGKPKEEKTEVVKAIKPIRNIPTDTKEEKPKEESKEMTEEEMLQNQQKINLEYYQKLYGDSYTSAMFSKEGILDAELCKLGYGTVSELKDINQQLMGIQQGLAKLIEILSTTEKK
jgi:hypothetical protein